MPAARTVAPDAEPGDPVADRRDALSTSRFDSRGQFLVGGERVC